MTYNEYLDFYNVLDIAPGASQEDVKAAYLLLAKQYHPDRYQTNKDKKEAEVKFKRVAAAYEELKSVDESYDDFMKENSFSPYFGKEYSKINDLNNNSLTFLKFYFAQQDIQNPEKNKTSVRYDFKHDAIHVIQKYIKDNKLNLLYVYECIRTNKSIITVDNQIDDVENYSGILIKEVIYRQQIKNGIEYQIYIKKHKYFKNIDLSATLYVDTTYSKKKFDEQVTYKSKKLCPRCSGIGCYKCENGFIEFDHTINIKVPYFSKQPMFFEIKNGGNQSKLGNGKLFLEVIYDKNRVHQSGYKFQLKNKYQITFDPILHVANFIWIQLKLLYKTIDDNKHVSFLYFIITLLIIAIICMAVLL